MKHKKLYIAISIIALLFIIIIATHVLWLEAIARFLIISEKLSPADVIVVLGGGGPERVWNGVNLYKEKHGKYMIFTGMEYKLPGLRTTWPQLAKQEALSMGIPEEVIIMEERPTSTYEDAIFVKDDMLSRGFRSAIIVSSPHHTRRARMIFKKVFKDQKDISLQITPFEGGDFQVKKWWTRENELIGVVNEYCKLFLYLFKYVI